LANKKDERKRCTLFVFFFSVNVFLGAVCSPLLLKSGNSGTLTDEATGSYSICII